MMRKTFTSFFFCLIGLSCVGQNLILTRNQDKKIFKSGSIFEVVTGEQKQIKDKKCCYATELIGKIAAVSKDSLSFQLISYRTRTILDNIKLEDVFIAQSTPNIKNIARNDIEFLKNYKSERQRKNKNKRAVAGGILLVTGAATLLNILAVQDQGDKKNLLALGGAQIGLGIGLGISTYSKKYYLKNKADKWAIAQ